MNHKALAFREKLLHWHEYFNNRDLPWVGETDPYKVWLSEIILQQTRVEQGRNYYLKFIQSFPSVFDLANADQDEVLKLWQGLGYYSRARNMHFTAKEIAFNRDGNFPNNFKELLKLKGVGSYTAAAIASFVYEEPVAVLDGNVIRVLSRYLGIDTPFDTSHGRKLFQEIAQDFLDTNQPAQYNQAIMDFGATVCKPKGAICDKCVLAESCIALSQNKVAQLPVKKNKIKSKDRFFYSFLYTTDKGVLIEQRKEKDIWQNLYQLPSVEVSSFSNKQRSEALSNFIELNKGFGEIKSSEDIDLKQTLSHQKIHISFIELPSELSIINEENYLYARNLTKFAFPKIFILYLQGKSLI